MTTETLGPLSGYAQPLPTKALRPTTDPVDLGDIAGAGPEIVGLVGQTRAIGAMNFGIRMRKQGFNLYAMDLPGADRRTSLTKFLSEHVRTGPAPDDWVYVNNFASPEKPRALKLPPGTAVRLRDAMTDLIADLGIAIPALFEGDDYKSRRSAIDSEFEEAQERAFSQLGDKAREMSISIMRTPVGFAFAPMREGKVIKPDEFETLPLTERERIQANIGGLQEELKNIVERMPSLEKIRRDRVRVLNKEMASGTVGVAVRQVLDAFSRVQEVQDFLREVSEDLLTNIDVFLESAAMAANASIPMASGARAQDPRIRRYHVNVVVGEKDGERSGAPIVYEPNPTFQNLIGRIEHIAQMGALLTDFTLIRGGSLHRANGGYLIVDAREILSQPFAWPALKRSLRSREVRITSLAEQLSVVSTTSLEPDPIPLDVKVVLFGDRWLYYLLMALDLDFTELFKVEVDFNDEFDRTRSNVALYAQLIVAIGAREALRPIDRSAIARMIDEASRIAEDAEKLSLQIAVVSDILCEADHWAAQAKHDNISADDVAKAVGERRQRSDRLRKRALEAISRGVIGIATDGAATGQINGLSVTQLGATSFGRPVRITARTRLGAGKVIDIEREVELGGPLHSKGVLILSGFLAARYAPDVPISMHASLVFEQSYGGVDGDSASSAELYALLSALSEAPIRQSLAVTGSVNQFGEVQAIGGVNEKIEGFFDVCAARGLTGEQGVLIPASNVKHLMLREDIVDACGAGRFAIYSVSTIDQGVELLTGMRAGERDSSGNFPSDSVNGKVEAKLRQFAAARRRFGAERDNDRPNTSNDRPA